MDILTYTRTLVVRFKIFRKKHLYQNDYLHKQKQL